jgi:hypothetical protein
MSNSLRYPSKSSPLAWQRLLAATATVETITLERSELRICIELFHKYDYSRTGLMTFVGFRDALGSIGLCNYMNLSSLNPNHKSFEDQKYSIFTNFCRLAFDSVSSDSVFVTVSEFVLILHRIKRTLDARLVFSYAGGGVSLVLNSS